MVKTNAERQRAFRERQALRGINQIKVKGENGYYDERIRIAIAIKNMADDEELSDDFIEKLIFYSTTAIPPKNEIDKKFIQKKINQLLKRIKNEC